MNKTGNPPSSAGTSTASLVVPAMALTIVRSIPTQALIKEDFPAFGRPTTARRVRSSFTLVPSSQALPTSSIKSPNPRPCSAETRCPGPNPSLANSFVLPPAYPGSILLITNVTFCPARRNRLATSVSSTCSPSLPSTTKRTRWADAIAKSASRSTASCKPVPSSSPSPPVSIKTKGFPSQSASATKRSRVTPGRSKTNAIFLRQIRLKRALLPTLGRPTIATVGRTDSGSMRLSVARM